MRSIGWLVVAAVIGLSALGWARGVEAYSATARAFGTNGTQIQGGDGFTAASASALGASASANLATGELQAAAVSVFGTGVGTTQGDADFQDVVTLVPPPGYSASTIHVVLGMSTAASVSGAGNLSNYAYVTTMLNARWGSVGQFGINGQYCTSTGGGFNCPSGTSLPNVILAFDIPTSSPSLMFTASLRAHATGTLWRSNDVTEGIQHPLLSMQTNPPSLAGLIAMRRPYPPTFRSSSDWESHERIMDWHCMSHL